MVSIILSIVCFITFLFTCSAASFQLITEEEARRPEAYIEGLRGAIPLPDIVVEINAVHGLRRTTSPFRLVVQLRPFGNGSINLTRLGVLYLKDPFVDLRTRMDRFIDTSQRTVVIDMKDAEAPIGRHKILFRVVDSNELVNTLVFDFEVVKP